MKKYVFGLLTGLIISGTVVYGANYLYKADEVSYTPSDNNWNVSNVKDAVSELYDKASNSGAIYLGEFSTNTTIDVSSLGATSVDQFIAVSNTSPTFTFGAVSPNSTIYGSYTKPALTLTEGSLSLTLGYVNMNRPSYPSSVNFPVAAKVYYVGNIKEIN